MTNSNEDPLYVGTLEKAVRTLCVFYTKGPDLSLKEIVEASGIERSAAQRLVHTYVELGWLERDVRTRRVSLSPCVLDLAFAYLSRNPLVEIASAHLIELQKRLGVRVNLCVLEGTTIMYLLRLQTHREKFLTTLVGRRLPAYCTSGGRAILAHMPEEKVRDIIERSNRVKHTYHTETDPQKLQSSITEARQRGFAVQVEQCRHGEIAVAAPLLDESGHPVGAVSAMGHLARCDVGEFVARNALPVMEAAQAISRMENSAE